MRVVFACLAPLMSKLQVFLERLDLEFSPLSLFLCGLLEFDQFLSDGSNCFLVRPNLKISITVPQESAQV